MFIKPITCVFANVANKLSVRTIIIIPFVLQIVGTVGLVGYLSFKNGQQAVNDVASPLRREISDRIEQNLRSYLAMPFQILQTNQDAVAQGMLSMKNLEPWESYLARQGNLYNHVSIIGVGNEQGNYQDVERFDDSGKLAINVSNQLTGYNFQTYATNSQGKRTEQIRVKKKFDPRLRPWYKAAVMEGKPTWSEIYLNISDQTLGIAAVHPVYDVNNRLEGVLVVTQWFNEVSQYLRTLKIGKTGKAFIIERSGMMVATSTTEMPFKKINNKVERLKASDSSDTLTKATAKYLSTQYSDLNQIKSSQQLEFKVDGKLQFLQVLPLQDGKGLDWLILVVVPEADFMEQINANTRITILLCIVTLILATGIGIIIVRWITKPILRLNTAAKDIAQGEWDKTVEVNRSDEIGALAKSFNNMAAQLQASFTEITSLNTALYSSEKRLNEFLEAIPVGVSIHDATGKLSYFNQTAKQLTRKDANSEIPPEELAKFYQIYRAGTEQLYPTEELPALRALKGEALMIDDLKIHRDGQIIYLEVYSTPIFDETGNVIYSINAFTDITQRKQAEQVLADYNQALESQVSERTAELNKLNKQLQQEIIERQQVEQALRESEEKFQEIAETINQFFFIRSAITSQFLYVSPAYEKIWGRTCESLYEDPLSWMEALHPDDRKMVLNSLKKQFQGNSVEREYRIIHSDNLIRWIVAEVSVIRDETGQLLRFVGLAQDITERKLTEEALRNSEAQNLVLVNAIPDLMIRMARDGTYLDFKPAKNFKTVVSGSDFIGKNISEIMPPEVSQQRMQYVEQALSTGNPQSYEFQLSVNSKIYDQEARIIVCGENEVFVIVRDITARKQAEEALQKLTQQEQEKAQELELTLRELKSTQSQLIHAEKMSSLGQMVAGIAHEINNPVSFIHGNIIPAHKYCQDLLSIIELYQQTYPNPTPEIEALTEEIDLNFLREDYSKLLDSMQVGTERIRDIVLSLKNFSRLNENELKSVDIHQGIDSTLLILQHRLKSEGHRPAINVIKNYAKLPLITCSASQLNQVFMNLLSNAIDALKNQPEPHKITICTSVVNQENTSAISQFIRIIIADNGVGMSEQVRQKIFDPFFTTKPVGSGTGLGLSISHQIVVEKHQGQIRCNSTPGQGTEFIVEIPITLTHS